MYILHQMMGLTHKNNNFSFFCIPYTHDHAKLVLQPTCLLAYLLIPSTGNTYHYHNYASYNSFYVHPTYLLQLNAATFLLHVNCGEKPQI